MSKKAEKVLALPYYPVAPNDYQAVTLWPEIMPGQTCLNTGKHNYKISPEHKEEILRMLATGLSTVNVSNEMARRFGIRIAHQTIHETYAQGRANKARIDRLRKALDAQIVSHPAKSQRLRLDLIMLALNKSLETDNLKSFSSLMRTLQIELDGLAPLVDNSTHYHFNKMSDEKLIDEARKAGVSIPPAIAARIKQQISGQKN